MRYKLRFDLFSYHQGKIKLRQPEAKWLGAEPHALFEYPLHEVSEGPEDSTGLGLRMSSSGLSYGERPVKLPWVINLSAAERWTGDVKPRGEGERPEVLTGERIVNGKLSLYQENGDMRDILEKQIMECG